jgi:hypothetical protein
MRKSFHDLRAVEARSAPSFERVWTGAERRRAARPSHGRGLVFAAAALALAACAVTIAWPDHTRPALGTPSPAAEIARPSANVEPVAETPQPQNAPPEAADNRNSSKKQPKSPAPVRRARPTPPSQCAEC